MNDRQVLMTAAISRCSPGAANFCCAELLGYDMPA